MSSDPPHEEPSTESVDMPEDAETASQNPSGALAAKAAIVDLDALSTHPRTRTRTMDLWRLAWPVMLSMVLVTVVGLVDIAMVGQIGSDAQAAVGYATQFFFMAQSVLFAVSFACVALMSRFIGAGRVDEARRAMAASMAIAVGTAVTLVAVTLAAPRRVLLALNAEPHVVEMTIPYLELVMVSTILLAAALVMEGALRADRNTVIALRISAVVAAVKIVLSWGLIFGEFGFPRRELLGAGQATVLSQVVGLVLFTIVIRRRDANSPAAFRLDDLVHSGKYFAEVARISVPGVVERLALNFGLLVYFALLGVYGTAAVAAYTIGVRALSFTWVPGIGLAQAAGALVGQALGRDDSDDAERIGVRAAWLSFGVAAVLGSIAGLGRGPLSRVFTNDTAVVEALDPFLLCLAIAQPMLQLHFTLGGVHRGAGETWTPMMAATIGNWAVRVPITMFLVYVVHAPVAWLWVAIIFDHATRAIWLLVGFRGGKWKTTLRDRLAAAEAQS
jgi:putative MATE family efflux protein